MTKNQCETSELYVEIFYNIRSSYTTSNSIVPQPSNVQDQ